MNQESWHAVTPQYSQYDAQIQRLDEIGQVDLLQLQPRLKQALKTLCSLKGFTRLLVVDAYDNAFYRSLIKDGLSTLDANKPIVTTESLNIATLLGSYNCNDHGDIVTKNDGLVDKADGGYLIIPMSLLLANPSSWQILKSILLNEKVSPVNANPSKIANEQQSKSYDIKLVIVGRGVQISEFEYIDPYIYDNIALYTEIEGEIQLNETSINQYLGYLRWIIATYQLPSLSFGAVHRLMHAGARYTEDQGYMPIEVLWYLSLFQEAMLTSNGKVISEYDIDQAIENKHYREAYLQERALSDITDGQVIIETKGECIGQVNGLTVISTSGHPVSYGEPSRISCVIHFGDGDISDVERKAELGGNLHAKGMMIMQAFVSSALKLDEPLPYSASVVFEQSYIEVDGDSATLAELCSFVSALSEYPINQQIAVTGAVDQFGRVQAVGGLNEKIEGFYNVCKHQGLTGSQGVILPKSNLKHLSLHKDVVESIKNNEFHIWSVATVDDAIPIIMGKPFRDDDDEDSVINKIAQRIEKYERHEHSQGIVARIKNWFA